MSTAQQFPTTNNNKESNMYLDPTELSTPDRLANETIDSLSVLVLELQAEREARIERLNAAVANAADNAKQLDIANEWRKMATSNVMRIQHVLHQYAVDCELENEITEIIEKIEEVRSPSFPAIKGLSKKYEITLTYVITVDAKDEEQAQEQFECGEFDHLVETSDFTDLDVQEAC